jgi:hypothetical protein
MNMESKYAGVPVQAQFLSEGDIVNGHAVVDCVHYNDDDTTVTVCYVSLMGGRGTWILSDAHECLVTGIGRA